MTDEQRAAIRKEIEQLKIEIVREKRLNTLSKAKTERMRMEQEAMEQESKPLGQSIADDLQSDAVWRKRSRAAFFRGLRRGPGNEVTT